MTNTRTKISWTDATWSPVTGCSKVSPGCANCYAETLSLRFGTSKKPWLPENAAENVVLHPDRLDAPLHWKKPRLVFVNSMSDLFHENVPDEFIDRVFAVMAITGGERYRCATGSRCEHNDSPGCYHNAGGVKMPVHTYQILTKRPDRMLAYMTAEDRCQRIFDHLNDPEWSMSFEEPDLIAMGAGWPLSNVWLGVSVENQHWADERIPLLLQTPSAVRFISAEPLLGPVDLVPWLGDDIHEGTSNEADIVVDYGLDWVIVGGESGKGHRPLDLAWAQSIKDQCSAAGVAYFMKQDSGARPGGYDHLPEDLKIQEFP